MWLKVLPLCWAAILLALASLGSRRADGNYKSQAFVMAFVFGVSGVATIILGEYRPAAAAAIAARPSPIYGLLKGVGLPVDAACCRARSSRRRTRCYPRSWPSARRASRRRTC
jgi:hypothetical protein